MIATRPSSHAYRKIKKISIDQEVYLHRMMGGSGYSWDSLIGEANLAMKRLKKTLGYLKKQKAMGAPYPVEQNLSAPKSRINKCMTTERRPEISESLAGGER
jgi:hypothetical protein